VEGLADGGLLTPLQDAFVTEGGAQCGICTPGMLLSAQALLDANPAPSEPEIREAIAGTICRCTGYQRIVESIRTAAKAAAAARKPSDLFRNVPPSPPSPEVL
jgi:aerobic-type carbon monoxide dehydrogenase small subunit (CoxS/CutS family)